MAILSFIENHHIDKEIAFSIKARISYYNEGFFIIK